MAFENSFFFIDIYGFQKVFTKQKQKTKLNENTFSYSYSLKFISASQNAFEGFF